MLVHECALLSRTNITEAMLMALRPSENHQASGAYVERIKAALHRVGSAARCDYAHLISLHSRVLSPLCQCLL